MIELLSSILDAIPMALQPTTIIYSILGVCVGMLVGAIPGLGGAMTIAILLPLAFVLDFGAALGLLIGIYKGAIYGGSISAIAFGVPGLAASSATVADGHALTKMGYPRKALYTALYSSVIGDTTSDLVLIFATLPLAALALLFGPRGFLALFVVALSLMAMLTGDQPIKGIMSAALGILIATVGLDPVMGFRRLTFGIAHLESGFDIVPLFVGLFAISEMLILAGKAIRKMTGEASGYSEFHLAKSKKDRITLKDVRACLKPIAIGTAIGTFTGTLPGTGATLAAYLSYGAAKRVSRNPELFGRGAIEGVAAAEAGNNATCGATLIPLLAFGIPGSEIAALLGGALLLQGVTPGPALFIEHREVIFSLFMILFFANFYNLAAGYFLIPIYSRLSRIKPSYLVPAIFVLCTLGTFSMNNRMFDIYIMLIAGVLGYFLRIFKVPLGPLILAFIVANPMEVHLRRALLLGQGSFLSLFQSPLAIGLYLFAVLIVWIVVFKKGSATKIS